MGSDPGKGDSPAEDEEGLEILDDTGADVGLGSTGDDGAGENEDQLDVEDTPNMCGGGLAVPGVLMLLAFRVVMAQIAVRRGL